MFIGLIVGAVVCVLALAMSGAGHGWNSAFISAVSIVGAPLAGLAWSARSRGFGRVLAIVVLTGAIAFDVVLWRETMKEGTHYVERVWSSGPGFVLLWAALFASWQLLAATVALRFESVREAA